MSGYREPGFYWVRSRTRWFMGQWNGAEWFITGWRTDRSWGDADIDEIGPHLIPPDTQEEIEHKERTLLRTPKEKYE